MHRVNRGVGVRVGWAIARGPTKGSQADTNTVKRVGLGGWGEKERREIGEGDGARKVGQNNRIRRGVVVDR